ncbi:hypothetical protein GCM10023228_31200 [Brevibacillus fulvus]
MEQKKALAYAEAKAYFSIKQHTLRFWYAPKKHNINKLILKLGIHLPLHSRNARLLCALEKG